MVESELKPYTDFEPLRLATHETQMWRLSIEGEKLQSHLEGIALTKEQFGLSEQTAVQVDGYFRAFHYMYLTYLLVQQEGSKDGIEKVKDAAVLSLLYYHKVVSWESGLNYDIDAAADAELKMYESFYINKDVSSEVKDLVDYFSVVYGAPKEELAEAMNKRERALTIMNGIDSGEPTEQTWTAIQESLNEYYILLHQAVQNRVTD